ncbi:MAG: peptidogalycan biosysnthesis protein, partial [Hyphomonas sp.]
MDETTFRIDIATGLSEVEPDEWNAVANPPGIRRDPFLSWEFLEALESSGAATPDTGWIPRHILVRDANDVLRGAMPLYGKTHSRGEFVFDHSWADAFERAGGSYYPKLLSAVPFTPVTGRRRLTSPGPDEARIRALLLSAAVSFAEQNKLSSLHINFLEEEESQSLMLNGMLCRTDQQFHWLNRDYDSFDDFLAELSSSKRKNLRKERARAQEGLDFAHIRGSDITEAHLDRFYEF